MTNIKRNLTLLKYTILALMTALIVAPIWYWVFPDTFHLVGPEIDAIKDRGGMEALSLPQKIGGFVVTALPNFILVWALVYLFKLVSLLNTGRWFEQACENHCVNVGRMLLVYAITEIASRTLLILVLTINNPIGERLIHIEVEIGDLKTIVPALFALVVSYMMRLARLQRDELNAIV